MSSQTLTFANQAEFQKYCKQNSSKTIVEYKGSAYDVTEFLDSHPGGSALITDYKNQDISQIFHSDDMHEHSENATRMLAKYRIGKIAPEQAKQTEEAPETESYPKITKDKIEYNGFTIDRNRGMCPQVLKLTKKQYMHMIHNPIHLPHCRLFDTDLFEGFSRNPWYRIPLLWVPVAIYLMYYGLTFNYTETSFMTQYLNISSPDFSFLAVIATFLFGIFVWTFGEYVLHRGVFHFDDYVPDHPYALYLHFLIHGIHHTIPMDPDRLVFPPVLGVMVYTLLFNGLMSTFPGNLGRVLASGVVIGYIGYDMTHIYIHHCTPFIGHFTEMKRYHNKHHYVDGDKGYGITSKIWDKVFRTELL